MLKRFFSNLNNKSSQNGNAFWKCVRKHHRKNDNDNGTSTGTGRVHAAMHACIHAIPIQAISNLMTSGYKTMFEWILWKCSLVFSNNIETLYIAPLKIYLLLDDA